MTIPKYPFVVTVYRRPGSARPVEQHHSFEDIGVAHVKMGEFANDRTVVKTVLSVVIKEVNHHSRHRFGATDD